MLRTLHLSLLLWYASILVLILGTATGAQATELRFRPTPIENEAEGKNSNAFNPAVGHPTAEERRAFVAEISALAKEVVRGKSMPASVVAAQCIVESGFGFTRTAVFANNFLGIKDFNPRNRRYQLVGQRQDGTDFSPVIKNLGEDRIIYDEKRRRGNHYRIFTSREDCVRYLVDKLLEGPSYAKVRQRYAERRSAGQDLRRIADLYVRELGDVYYRDQSDPRPGGERYAEHILPVMLKWALYQLDEESAEQPTAIPTSAPAPVAAEREPADAEPEAAQLAALKRICSGGRYMEVEGRSSRWQRDLPGWESEREQLRLYRYAPGSSSALIPKSLTVLLWDPSPELAARWVVDAVAHSLGSYDHQMARYYAAAIRFQSGFQFPVRGFVFENGKVFAFWDGVTVSLDRQANPNNFTFSPDDLAALRSPEAEETPLFKAAFAADDAAVKNTGRQGRIVSVTKGTPGVPAGDAPFRKFVREGHIRAMGAGHSEQARIKFRNNYGKTRDTAFKKLQNEIRLMISREGRPPASDAEVEAIVVGFERGA